MQAADRRALTLGAVLAIGALAAFWPSPVAEAASARSATAVDARVDGWRAGPATSTRAHGVEFVTRSYRDAGGRAAEVTISVSTEAKRIYRAGSDVPFLGSGYVVDPAPPSLVPPDPLRAALVARREQELLLIVTARGERRGILGNGVVAWAFATLDGVLGASNDYYQVSVVSAVDPSDPDGARRVVELADRLLPRVAERYSR